MKKFFKFMLLSMVMVFSLSTIVLAAPTHTTSAKDLQQKLRNFGMPEKHIGNIVEHLQKTKIDNDTASKLMYKIDAAKNVIGNEKDLSKLSEDKKQQLHNHAIEAAGLIGATAEFGKDSNGATLMHLKDSNGHKILSIKTIDAIPLVTNFDIESLRDIAKSAIDFSNNPDKAKFDPISGAMTKTATSYGNLIMVGLGLVALSGVVFFKTRKLQFN